MPARTSHFYDLIVLGSELAGLVAATVAARRDRRVLVIPEHDVEQTFTVGHGPPISVETAPCLGLDGGPVRRAFEELGTWQHVRRNVRPLKGGLHYALDGEGDGGRGAARLDLGKKLSQLGHELVREWPDEPAEDAWSQRRARAAGAIEHADAVLGGDPLVTPDMPWNRRYSSRADEERPTGPSDDDAPLPPGHPMRHVGAAVLPWLSDLSVDQLDWSIRERLIERWFAGPSGFDGGLPALRAHLVKRLRMHAGDVKPGLRAASVLMNRGRVSGLSFLGKRQHFGCEHLLIAGDPRHVLGETLATELVPAETMADLAEIDVAAQRFVLALEVEPDGISPVLGGTLVHVPESSAAGGAAARYHGATYLRFLPPPRVKPGTPEGPRRLLLTHIVPRGVDTVGLRERILDGLDRAGVLPFVANHVRSMYSPHDGREPTDGHGRPIDGAPAPVRPWPMAPIYAHRSGRAVLGFGLLPHSTPLKNLYLASSMTYPGLGFEGQFAAGLAAAGLVAEPPARGKTRRLFRGRV